MRLRFSPEVERLWSIIEPYLKVEGLRVVLDENAPDEVKEADKKWQVLSKKEYIQAMGYDY